MPISLTRSGPRLAGAGDLALGAALLLAPLLALALFASRWVAAEDQAGQARAATEAGGAAERAFAVVDGVAIERARQALGDIRASLDDADPVGRLRFLNSNGRFAFAWVFRGERRLFPPEGLATLPNSWEVRAPPALAEAAKAKRPSWRDIDGQSAYVTCEGGIRCVGLTLDEIGPDLAAALERAFPSGAPQPRLTDPEERWFWPPDAPAVVTGFSFLPRARRDARLARRIAARGGGALRFLVASGRRLAAGADLGGARYPQGAPGTRAHAPVVAQGAAFRLPVARPAHASGQYQALYRTRGAPGRR